MMHHGPRQVFLPRLFWLLAGTSARRSAAADSHG